MDTKATDIARAEVMTVLDRRIEASRAKDIDRLMAVYSPGIVLFDIIPRISSPAPARSAGTSRSPSIPRIGAPS